jgi:hypothetical protein
MGAPNTWYMRMGTGVDRALGGSNATLATGEATDAGEAVPEALGVGEGETNTEGDADGDEEAPPAPARLWKA